jgi:hypothetical protein
MLILKPSVNITISKRENAKVTVLLHATPCSFVGTLLYTEHLAERRRRDINQREIVQSRVAHQYLHCC